jgi:hypothetical protein
VVEQVVLVVIPVVALAPQEEMEAREQGMHQVALVVVEEVGRRGTT